MLKQVVTAISKSNSDSLIKGVEYAMLLEVETNGNIIIELYPLMVPGRVIVYLSLHNFLFNWKEVTGYFYSKTKRAKVEDFSEFHKEIATEKEVISNNEVSPSITFSSKMNIDDDDAAPF